MSMHHQSRISSKRPRPLLVPELAQQYPVRLEERALAGSFFLLHSPSLMDLQPLTSAGHASSDSAALQVAALTQRVSLPVILEEEILGPKNVMSADVSAQPLTDIVGVVAIYDPNTSSPGHTVFDVDGTFNPPIPILTDVPFIGGLALLTDKLSLTSGSTLVQHGTTADQFTQEDFYTQDHLSIPLYSATPSSCP